MTPRTITASTVALALAACALGAPRHATGQPLDTTGTRAAGVQVGPHAVGFEVRAGLDTSRPINQTDGGTRIGIATWYPSPGGGSGSAMTALQYRLLGFFDSQGPQQQRDFEADEVDSLMAWRHIGIVEMTREQARESLYTRGIAVHGAPETDGRFPVVVMLGGSHYLSTTAEILASHGFLVVAPFRYTDQSNEIGTSGFGSYIENSVRDAEWALDQVRARPDADMAHVSAIGHGGGGMIAMLLTMRNRSIGGLVNIDAGNFSKRSRTLEQPFYSARLMRVPYLFIATADTRASQDLFDEFQAMRFSERFEVILDHSQVRHHDLSDYGRAVTAPMAIRGAAQADVQQRYVDVHEMTVRFLLERSGRPSGTMRFAEWLQAQSGSRYTVSTRTGTEPAPTLQQVMATADGNTVLTLRDARRRDPAAPLFEPTSLTRLIAKALATRDFQGAIALADFAVEAHPDSPVLLGFKSQALEGAGDLSGAATSAAACAAMQASNDWRASAAIDRCRNTAARLR